MLTQTGSGATLNVAAVDLGAGSGRVILGRYNGATLSLEEVARFPNQPVRIDGHLHWDVRALWQGIVQGLGQARAQVGALHSVGVDAWGVDYALIDSAGTLLEQPFHYRDTRTQGVMEQICTRIAREAIYAQTGIQFLPFNTLYQLVAHRQAQPAQLDAASRLLLIPDLMHMWLCGEQVCEYTNATTTQMWSVGENRWATAMIEAAGLPTHLLPPVVAPGTVLGPLLPALADELGAGTQVSAPATHDTASAIAAVPARAPARWAYISSGTWSLVGLELPRPLIRPEGLQANFTNEGGVFGTTRFLKNVMGLWLLQECRRTWEQEGRLPELTRTYEQLFALADAEEPFAALIDPDDAGFLAPGDMPARIQEYLRHHLLVPKGCSLASAGAVVRCILESLVLRYRQVLADAAALAETAVDAIHVVGGGSQSALLNQWLADGTGLPVVAGPVEASALGNVLMQLVALGEFASLAEVRQFSAATTPTAVFQPQPDQKPRWDDAYGRFQQLGRLA
jgi:rhamnulokinase